MMKDFLAQFFFIYINFCLFTIYRSGNQVDSMQGLDEEISNNSRQPLFQKSESENNSR